MSLPMHQFCAEEYGDGGKYILTGDGLGQAAPTNEFLWKTFLQELDS